MQTPKTSTKSSSGSEGGRRVSPQSVSSSSDRTSGRVVRQLKTTRLEPPKTPRTTSPKIVDRASPRSHVTEKNRLGRISELETQVTQLEDALRTVKDQLIVSESWKKQAKIDAEESRKELLALSLRLEESQKLLDQSSSKEAREDDDSAALAAALIEIDQLKVKLITTTESEAIKTKQAESAEAEIHTLKENIAETLSKMKEMKNQLEDCKVSESKARALATETLQQLEAAKKNMESLSINSDAYNEVVMELQHSRARVRCLEEIVENMKKTEQCSQTMELTAELKKSKEDIEELKANLMDKETELQCVVEENEDLNAKLGNLITGVQENELKEEVNGLKSKLTTLENELRKKSDENEKLKLEIKRLTSLESKLLEKYDENENLRLEIHKMKGAMEESKQEVNGLKSKLIIMDTDLCEKSNENETLKLEIKKTDGVMETVKMRSCELEEELRKLKLQMGQWRKAAEVATAMLCDENKDNNGRMVADRAWSMGHYSPRKKMNTTGSPLNMEIDDDNDNDDDDEEFLKRKNGNMLKRIGVLWKKPQNK
ncbi:putative interactor of constitutively active ROPs [Helianthus annuus]|nr:putative interactor of constitutively active ROPs [Helianthus annuus]